MTSAHARTPKAVWAAALKQASIELRNSFLTGSGLTYLIGPVIMLVLTYFLRDSDLLESSISIAQNLLPGMLAFGFLMGGVIGVASELFLEREDGTLLRMKAIPHGVQGFLSGKLVTHLILNIVSALLVLVPVVVFFPGAMAGGVGRWLAVFGLLVIAVVVTMPLGALMGAALRSNAQIGVASMGTFGLAAISGVFVPLTLLPQWLQVIGQAFPLYWLGLGFRRALLPPEAVLLEVGGTWRTTEMVVVLAVWVLIGVVGAPIALRKMIRGVSGSKVAESRERMLSRGY
ncbi:MAG: ABC transporter permease [Ruaniaceae bacterium]|nr:ABC transporter permease [Ruaniaceae bacterium]